MAPNLGGMKQKIHLEDSLGIYYAFLLLYSSSLRAKYESLMYHEIGMFNRRVVNGNSKVWPCTGKFC